MPKYPSLGSRPLGITITLISNFGFALVGYDQGRLSKGDLTRWWYQKYWTGVMSGVIQIPLWLANFPAVDGNANMLGFTVAIYDIGCSLGALVNDSR